MTRYGFAIKALPEGVKPFGQDDDENEEAPGLETSSPGGSGSDASLDPADELPEDPTAAPFAPAEGPAAPPEDPAAPPAGDAPAVRVPRLDPRVGYGPG